MDSPGTTFAFDWKVLICPSLSFGIISLFAYLPVWMTLLMLYARSIVFFVGFVKLNILLAIRELPEMQFKSKILERETIFLVLFIYYGRKVMSGKN